MAKKNLSDLTNDELVAQSQELGRQIDGLREQRIAIADEIRARADRRAALQAQLDEIDGVHAVGQGQVIEAKASV